MSNPKALIEAFYNSDAWKNPHTLKSFLHPEYQQYWHGPKGFLFYDHEQLLKHGEDLRDSFVDVQFKISHLIAKGQQVVLRYAVYAATKQAPHVLTLHAHFIAIWKVKEGKLYRCYEVSAPADNSAESLRSYQK